MGLNVFWDNSNIWLVGKSVCEEREPGDESAFRIHFANLFDFAVNNRKVDYAFLGGSVPPNNDKLWERFNALRVEVEKQERGAATGSEVAVDESIHLAMANRILDCASPETVVLLTGDGSGYSDGKGFIKQLGTSIWALAAVVIVVFGVVGGVFTATESAAIAVIYSLLVSVFVYKGLDWKGVWHALDECVNTLSIVLILIATSAVFGNCLTMLHVPDLAATAITDLTDNPYIIALLIDLILLVLGMIMDMAPIILIATPILLPIATSIGIDPIQFGIIVVLNCGIGLLTPPVGAVLFIGSAVAKRPMEKVVKATLPFYLCMFVALLLLTFIPDISLAIPKLLGGYVSPITNPLGPVFIH